MLGEPGLEDGGDRVGQAHQHEVGELRARLGRGIDDGRHLRSVRPGITGATFTPTGTPAWASVRIASSLLFGIEVRGSMMRWSSLRSVVTERMHDTASCFASSMSRSTSRVIRWFFVIT